MQRIIVLILLAVVSSGATAGGWVKVSYGVNGTTVYADPSTIRKKGSKVKMWVLFDNTKTYADAPFLSDKEQDEFDCNEEHSRLSVVFAYSENMGKGEVVFKNLTPTTWIPIPPDSVSAVLFSYACDKKYRAAIDAQAKREKVQQENIREREIEKIFEENVKKDGATSTGQKGGDQNAAASNVAPAP